jgi:predicted regulator of Ras-like GTPase activity (Roadblock/LC7/MglB family)
VGSTTALAIGADGFPIISYYDVTNGDLKVAKCGDAACSSGNTITSVDSTGDVGAYSSIAVATDGLPVISYFDITNLHLKVIKCGNAACSSGNTTTTVDAAANVGRYTSLAIGTDGLPVIAYYDESLGTTNGVLSVVKCGNAACSSGNTTTDIDTTPDVGQFSSIAIGSDGFPIISYYDSTSDNLKVTKCGDAACSSGNTTTAVDSTGDVGRYTSIAIGTDGLAIISYYDVTNTDLKALKCGNAACSSGNTTTTVHTSVQTVGLYTSIAIGADGLPVISYYNFNATQLYLAKCGNAACSSGNATVAVVSNGEHTSLAIGADGFPVISHYDPTNFNLEVAKCVDAACSLTSAAATFSGINIGNTAKYFNNIYAQRFWGKNFTIANFDLAENYEVAEGESVSAGDVVAFNEDGKLVKAGGGGAIRTIGVISTEPGLLLSNWQDASSTAPVALAGRVPVNVDTSEGIQAGDTLTLSDTPGIARKAKPGETTLGTVRKVLSDTRVEMMIQMDGTSNTFTSAASLLDQSTTSASSTSRTGAMSAWVGSFANASESLKADITSLADTVISVLSHAIYATVGIFEKVFAREIHTDQLCISDDAGETCVTRSQLDSLLASAGMAGTSTPPVPTSSGTSTQNGSGPLITLNGANPAHIEVGDIYIDLGAIVSDDQDTNLSYTTTLDGLSVDPNSMLIDTSMVGEHTIVYSATDSAGNIGMATRTVFVGDPSGAATTTATTTISVAGTSTSATTTDSGVITTVNATDTSAAVGDASTTPSVTP